MPSVRETREQYKRGLAMEILQSSGSVRLQAWGTSMLPSIWPGDLLTIERTNQIQVGDIVLRACADRFFVHRVVEKPGAGQEHQWITRGDCVPTEDPPAALADLLGTVSAIQREGGTIIPARKRSSVPRVVAWLLCHCDVLRGFALRLHALRQQRGLVTLRLRKASEAQHS